MKKIHKNITFKVRTSIEKKLKLVNEFYENKREFAVKGLIGDSDSLRSIDFRLELAQKSLTEEQNKLEG
jgi:hypothetical protein